MGTGDSVSIVILADNIGCGELVGEWGLSMLVEYGGKRFLLDTGSSDRFISNAQILGIDIGTVDFAVLSHAHYDHTGGLEAFLQANQRAPVYLSRNAEENCYSGSVFPFKYIGMPAGVAGEYPQRIIRAAGVSEISPGVYLIPHSTRGLSKLGRRNRLYVRRGIWYVPDDFSHEQTLVFRTPGGLVLMNSCSHSGPEIVVQEVLQAFPGEHIKAYVGGLHLFRLNGREVRAVSDRLSACGVDRLYTGHCTGQEAYEILTESFAGKIDLFRCGLRIKIA